MTYYYLGMIIALAWAIDAVIDDASRTGGFTGRGRLDPVGILLALILVMLWPVMVLGAFANAIGTVWDASRGRDRP